MKIIQTITGVILSMGLLVSPSLALAATSTTTGSTTISVKAETRIKDRGNQEIDRRVTALNALKTRVNAMVRINDADKASLSSQLDSQINGLNVLKTKIGSETDATALKQDVKDITGSYRIFALVLPQGHILSAVDRIVFITDTINTVGTKLQTRIAQAQTAGKDVTALNTALTDLGAKTADAKNQAQQAVTLTQSLKPDNGDQATFDANKKALVAARANIKTAEQDLKAARKDAQTIQSGLKALNLNSSGTATSTP